MYKPVDYRFCSPACSARLTPGRGRGPGGAVRSWKLPGIRECRIASSASPRLASCLWAGGGTPGAPGFRSALCTNRIEPVFPFAPPFFSSLGRAKLLCRLTYPSTCPPAYLPNCPLRCEPFRNTVYPAGYKPVPFSFSSLYFFNSSVIR